MTSTTLNLNKDFKDQDFTLTYSKDSSNVWCVTLGGVHGNKSAYLGDLRIKDNKLQVIRGAYFKEDGGRDDLVISEYKGVDGFEKGIRDLYKFRQKVYS